MSSEREIRFLGMRDRGNVLMLKLLVVFYGSARFRWLYLSMSNLVDW